jgi:drug/metabolite transporter (DMT)-like permease
MNKKILAVFYWTALVLSDTAAQLLYKAGALKTMGWRVDPWVFVGYACNVVSFVLWMQILKTTRLTIALSTASALYITVIAGSYYFMGEPLNLSAIIGTILIATGVFILNAHGKEGF